MRTIIWLLTVFTVISCSRKEPETFNAPKQVIIEGKIKNIDLNNLGVKLYVNQISFGQKEIFTKADSLGNFKTSFNTYLPTDLWITYKLNFLVLVNPGDSLYVEFDGNPDTRSEILNSIKFSGDDSQMNQEAAKFQQMYYSSPLYNPDVLKRVIKEYDIDQCMLYLDTLQQRNNDLYNTFISEISPHENVRNWAKLFLEHNYYYDLYRYFTEHPRVNKLKDSEWRIPDYCYDLFLKQLPISESMFMSGGAISQLVSFHYANAMRRIWNEASNKKYIENKNIVVPTEIIDTLIINGIIKYTPDTLLRQMVFTEFFAQNLKSLDVRLFEKYRTIIETYIQQPFLKEPLFDLYKQAKNRLENPKKLASDAILKNFNISSAKGIMDTILWESKGKVIYLDCWATWCGPCKAEMPNSKELVGQMRGKDVSFVYLCLDSEEKIWNTVLIEFQLNGRHYFLNQEQSIDFRKAFGIQGIPYYFLINKNGTIVEKGAYLRPKIVKEKIDKLL